jgi:hypothetical protein
MLAVAVMVSAGCDLLEPRDSLRTTKAPTEEPDLLVEGAFARELAELPCDLLSTSMVSEQSEIDEEELQRYELGGTCAYVWHPEGQAALRNLTITDTIEEAQERHLGSLAFDDCEPIDAIGYDACVRVLTGSGADEVHSVSVGVRVSNARFSVAWAGSEPVMDRLHAVALARKVVEAIPRDDPESFGPTARSSGSG